MMKKKNNKIKIKIQIKKMRGYLFIEESVLV